MKKLMLSTAVAAFAFVVSPAMAQEDSGVKLNLGGHFKGYVSYVDQDELTGSETRDFDILRETEVHFGGETTLDNGLTVGAHIEAEADANDSFDVDESYAYFAGSWGRVNFGDEDGAAYLLQVAAPSADDNVDGIRQFINPFNYTNATANNSLLAINGQGTFASVDGTDGMDYDNDFTGPNDKLTYLSPVFNGFQAGVSYTPDVEDNSDGVSGNNTDDVAGELGAAWELAARYEGMFNTVGVILGAGYTHVDLEEDAVGQDDLAEWNVGADLDIGAFGVGAIYTENNNGQDANDKNETWVLGADYTTGPFKLGVSYLNNDNDADGVDVESDRIAGGVVYSYGPGMTFRGSIQHVSHDIEAADDVEGTAVLLGTQVNF